MGLKKEHRPRHRGLASGSSEAYQSSYSFSESGQPSESGHPPSKRTAPPPSNPPLFTLQAAAQFHPHKGTTLQVPELGSSPPTLRVTISANDNQRNSSGFLLYLPTVAGGTYQLTVAAQLLKGDKAFLAVESSDHLQRLVSREKYQFTPQQGLWHTEVSFVAQGCQTHLGLLFFNPGIEYELLVSEWTVRSGEEPLVTGADGHILIPRQSAIIAANVRSPAASTTEVQGNLVKAHKSLVRTTHSYSSVVGSDYPPTRPPAEAKSPDTIDCCSQKVQWCLRGQKTSYLNDWFDKVFVLTLPGAVEAQQLDWFHFALSHGHGVAYERVVGVDPQAPAICEQYRQAINKSGPRFIQECPDERSWALLLTWRVLLRQLCRQDNLTRCLFLVLTPAPEAGDTSALTIDEELNHHLEHLQFQRNPLYQSMACFLGARQHGYTPLQAESRQRQQLFYHYDSTCPLTDAWALGLHQGFMAVLLQQLEQLLTMASRSGAPGGWLTLLNRVLQSEKWGPLPVTSTPWFSPAPTNQGAFSWSHYLQGRAKLSESSCSLRQALWPLATWCLPEEIMAHCPWWEVSTEDPSQQSNWWRALWGFFAELYQQYAQTVAPDEEQRINKYHFLALWEGVSLPIAIIVPSYNNRVSDNYRRNAESLCQQHYEHYRVIFVDDASTDGTLELVRSAVQAAGAGGRWRFEQQRVNQKQGASRYLAAQLCDDDEIVALVDGDDWLAHPYAVAVLSDHYQRYDLWASYGAFYRYTHRRTDWKHLGGDGQFPAAIVHQQLYRHYRWISQHWRTGRAFLFKQLRLGSLLHEDGRFYQVCTDLAESYPLLEMSGTAHRNTETGLYVYNQDNSRRYPTSFYNQRQRSAQDMNVYRQQVLERIKGMTPYQPVGSLERAYERYEWSSSSLPSQTIVLWTTTEVWRSTWSDSLAAVARRYGFAWRVVLWRDYSLKELAATDPHQWRKESPLGESTYVYIVTTPPVPGRGQGSSPRKEAHSTNLSGVGGLPAPGDLEGALRALEATKAHGYHRSIRHIPSGFPVLHLTFAGELLQEQAGAYWRRGETAHIPFPTVSLDGLYRTAFLFEGGQGLGGEPALGLWQKPYDLKLANASWSETMLTFNALYELLTTRQQWRGKGPIPMITAEEDNSVMSDSEEETILIQPHDRVVPEKALVEEYNILPETNSFPRLSTSKAGKGPSKSLVPAERGGTIAKRGLPARRLITMHKRRVPRRPAKSATNNNAFLLSDGLWW